MVLWDPAVLTFYWLGCSQHNLGAEVLILAFWVKMLGLGLRPSYSRICTKVGVRPFIGPV
jgi:hypothetical protein